MRDFLSELRPAVLALIVLTALTGVVYPLAVTGIAQVAFPAQAEGSLVVRGGEVIGSTRIGQAFTDPAYFWGRPSATTTPYDAMASTADNLGPANPDLAKAIGERVAALRAADPGNTAPVPIDLVTTSASGLDPDISPAAAYFQARRIARVRGLTEAAVRALVARHVEERALGILGDPHVNVLALNLDLDTVVAQAR